VDGGQLRCLNVRDKNQPLLKIPQGSFDRMYNRLCLKYSKSVAQAIVLELERILHVYYAHKPREMIEKEKDFDPANGLHKKTSF